MTTIDRGDDDSHHLADLVAREAHAARNQLATLRGAHDLIDDPQAADEVRAAVDALVRLIDRSVVAARIERGDEPRHVSILLGELLLLAQRRARREGAGADLQLDIDGAGVVLAVPGSWAERALADVLHAAVGADSVALGSPDAGHVPLRCRVEPERWEDVADYVRHVVRACDGELHVDADLVTVRLPTA